MTRPTDELLMAYADGTLPPEQSRELERLLVSSPADRALVEQFKSSAKLARQALDDIDMQPRADLIALVRGGEPRKHDAENDAVASVIPFLRKPRRTVSMPRFALPLAAGLALIVGFGSGYLATTNRAQVAAFSLGAVHANSSLAAVLDAEASGGPAKRRPELQIVATFLDRTNRPCREIERLDAQASKVPIAAAIACRDGNRWVVEGAARVVTSASTGGVKPSSTQDRDALASVLDGLGAKPALSRADEQRLIEQRWR